MPKSRKPRASAPPKRKAPNSLNDLDLSESDPEIPQSPDAGTAAAIVGEIQKFQLRDVWRE